MRVSTVLLVGALCLSACQQQPATEPGKLTGETLPAVDAIFNDWDQPDGPGCSLAVAHNGELIYSRGYGQANLDHNIPNTPQTVFDVASITKQFVAAGLTVLEQEGRLSLDDDVRRWIPELPAYGDPITLRHMVHHTAGLRDYLTLFPLAGRDDYTPISRQQILDMMVRQRALVFAPGESWDYSNTAYMLLAVVLERAAEQAIGDFMQEWFFGQLGMRGSYMYDDMHAVIPHRSTGYGLNAEGNWQIVHNPNFDVTGDGQLYTTVEDLLRWDAYIHGPESELAAAMTEDGSLNNGEPLEYARGIGLVEYRGMAAVGHSGGSWGFSSQIRRFLEPALSIAVACNANEAPAGSLLEQVADYFLADELGPVEEGSAANSENVDSDRPEPIEYTETEIAQFSGSYFSPELDAIYRIESEAGESSLTVRIEQEEPRVLQPVVQDRFSFDFHPHGWPGPSRVVLTFVRDKQGAVAGFELDTGSMWGIAFLQFEPLHELPSQGSTVITNARVMDGSGSAARNTNVRLVGDRIASVSSEEPLAGDTIVNARGMVLVPGFIDAHSHHGYGLLDAPSALAAVSQGVTTIAEGMDGGHDFPLGDFFNSLEERPSAINVASYVGFGTLRSRVMGDDFQRTASEEEIRTMITLLEKEMAAGALGLSTGLEYDPGSFSSTEELVRLAKATAAMGGRYVSHIRSEDQYFWEAIDEAIHIGRAANIPVRISHIKLAMTRWWGQADRLIKALDEARSSGVDISADIYPYQAWNAGFSWLVTLFPERDLDRRDGADYILNDMLSPEGILLPEFSPDPAYNGLTIAQIAQLRESDPASTLMDLLKADVAMGSRSPMLGFAMNEPDIEAILAWPHTVVGSDGQLEGPHPRGFGAFTRVLGHYVRERRALSLEEAIRKMTSRTAEDLGLRERGLIREGYYADMVLFDPDAVMDRATAENPHQTSLGIDTVWVNGQVVWNNGRVSGKRPGRVIRRAP